MQRYPNILPVYPRTYLVDLSLNYLLYLLALINLIEVFETKWRSYFFRKVLCRLFVVFKEFEDLIASLLHMINDFFQFWKNRGYGCWQSCQSLKSLYLLHNLQVVEFLYVKLVRMEMAINAFYLPANIAVGTILVDAAILIYKSMGLAE